MVRSCAILTPPCHCDAFGVNQKGKQGSFGLWKMISEGLNAQHRYILNVLCFIVAPPWQSSRINGTDAFTHVQRTPPVL